MEYLLGAARILTQLAALGALACTLTAHATETLRVAIYRNPPLLDYADPHHPRGVFIDVLQSAATEYGWTLNYVPGTFAEALDRVRSGEVDLIPNASRTAQREAFLHFTRVPVVNTWGQVYARPGSAVHSILDLAGKRVVGVSGTFQMEYFGHTASAFGVAPVLEGMPNYAAAAEEVHSGRADALLANPFSGAQIERAGGLVNTSIMFGPHSQYFAAARSVPQLVLDRLDQQLTTLQTDPNSAYFASMQRLARAERGPSRVPPWLPWVALAGCAALVTGLAWAWTIARAAEQTRDAERGQRRLAQELTRISDNSLDVIAVLDSSFSIIRINRATERVWGLRRFDLEGRSSLDLIAPADRTQALLMLEQVRAGRSVRSIPNRIRHRDGRLVRMRWSLHWSPQERELYAIGRDQTPRRDWSAGAEGAALPSATRHEPANDPVSERA